ncbi:exopolysaccharide biosynthesis polyprenyl glycosylphosphotransferase [Parasphaerochaeta coccoides]|uniref:Undecaprenyl-phosphate galactose phosphotransferase n=1 Tax=Parasphaerochaeta coccoides (strain ATCC BAA-1237 / DSM 17374 / SPN1) TaxID=760011 RepID=F4GLR5_PARC1|nr:exopolysaccharide biosynthesis polyprenyl glycosylphosphotransferase [Parasphaerochaeta coccoides]AEC02459.1 Undecaprenyl-phosphate galactose phosphotransferase [Parasphaerochaeta coccoides DSM 17374]
MSRYRDYLRFSIRICADRRDIIINQASNLLEQRSVFLPSLPGLYIGNKIVDFHWLPELYPNHTEQGLLKRAIKRGFDFIASLCAVIVLSPLLGFIALLVKLSSPGKVLYRQQRVTGKGRVFTMYKFRSMRSDMPENGDAHWTKKGDPRITPIGAFLRKTSIDELPQLFNVIGGSMSLIGPRPERSELVARFEKEIPGYRLRYNMKAGISGWAQVNGWRGDTSLERRIECDLYYIKNWGLFFDVKIILLTFFRGFLNKNAY